MSDESTQDKQLPASERKLRKAREDGQVVRSRDLGHFLAMLAGTAALLGLAPLWLRKLETLLTAGLRFDARTIAAPDMMLTRLSQWGVEALLMVLPVAAGLAIAAVASSVISGGWVMSFKVIQPKFSKLNPISGIGRMFGKERLVDALKGCLLGLILGGVGIALLVKAWPSMVNLLSMPLPAAVNELGMTLASVIGSMLLVIAVFAIVDLPLQRFMFAKRMRMSHKEAKEEMKQQEGNMEVKGRVKQKMREMARKRMLAAVPTADLVVMNPTHYAVALKYDEASAGAPRVVAKGLDLLALKIRDLATENRVPVLEAPPLARALYANTEVDMEIPVSLYSAVAQVLAYVFQLRQAMAGHAPLPGNLPDLDVPASLDPLNPAHKKGRAGGREMESDA